MTVIGLQTYTNVILIAQILYCTILAFPGKPCIVGKGLRMESLKTSFNYYSLTVKTQDWSLH